MIDEADPATGPSARGPLASAPGDGREAAKTRAGSARRSRFDRGPQPHDWRWVVGAIGKILVATGILMFGFVGYQLWGTALQTAAAQDRLEDRFEQRLQRLPTLPSAGEPATTAATAPTPAASVAPATVPATTDGMSPNDPSTPTTVVPATSVAPASPGPAAPPPRLPTPEPLDVVAKIEIPEMGVDHYVVEGVTRAALMQGPGHFPESPLPGQLGNAAIAGHRTTYGAPFGNIDRMGVGDEIIVTVPGAGTYYYVTDGIEIVLPEDYGAVMPGDPDRATLILVSCHPKYTTQKRLIVHATLDQSRSDIVTEPSPIAPAEDGQLANEDVNGAAVDVVPSPPASEAGSEQVLPHLGAGNPTPTQGDTTAPDDGEDAFGAGWFSDDAAWPHVAAWGALLTLVSMGAYGVSRWVRRNTVGALVGTGPFLVSLYFFYENVNRLLPPAL